MKNIINKTLFLLGLTLVIGVNFTACSSDRATETEPYSFLMEDYISPLDDKLSTISNAKDSAIVNAMAAYNTGEYEKAIDLFPNFAYNYKQVGYIHLYKGISQLIAGKEYDSFKTFGMIRANQGEAFELSNWYLALNYIKFNNALEAKKKLKTIIDNNYWPKDKAVDLLKELEKQQAKNKPE